MLYSRLNHFLSCQSLFSTDIGELIGTPFQDYLKDEADVQETFDAFEKLIQGM